MHQGAHYVFMTALLNYHLYYPVAMYLPTFLINTCRGISELWKLPLGVIAQTLPLSPTSGGSGDETKSETSSKLLEKLWYVIAACHAYTYYIMCSTTPHLSIIDQAHIGKNNGQAGLIGPAIVV